MSKENKECQNFITKDFADSLFENGDIGVDYLEIGIDSIVENELIKTIPVAKTICAIIKVSTAFHEKNLLRQTLIFLQEFNARRIDAKKLEKYKDKINSNSNAREKELGRVMLLLHRYIDDEKSKILARFFYAYVNEEISWGKFSELSDALDRLFMADINWLLELFKDNDVAKPQRYQYERLNALGLTDTQYVEMLASHIGWKTIDNSEDRKVEELEQPNKKLLPRTLISLHKRRCLS